MEDLPPLVHESTPTLDSDPDCPFCAIIENYPPISPSLLTNPKSASHLDPHKLDPPAFVVLSTPHVIAFLDVYPLTRGHVLICPRRHGVKLGDLTSTEGAEIGRLLPLLSRALTASTMPTLPPTYVDYNIVQNNGPGAAQVVPHTHFHFVPRYPFAYVPPRIESYSSEGEGGGSTGREAGGGGGGMEARYVVDDDGGGEAFRDDSNSTGERSGKREKRELEFRNEQPKGMKATAILFGRGQRHYRDDEEAEDLVKVMRGCVKEEWEREFGREGRDEVGGDEVGGESTREGEMVRRNGFGERGGKL